MIGNITLNMSRGFQVFTGSVDNVVDSQGAPVAGQMALSGGITDGSFSGSADSTLGLPAGSAPQNGMIFGTYLGPSGEAVRGSINPFFIGQGPKGTFIAEP